MIIYYFCKEFTILLRKIRYLLDFENNLKLEDMNRLKSVLLLCFVMMMAVSCKDKEEPVHTLQFDVEGLKLSYDAITGAFDGDIPSEGSVFTIIGKGEYSNYVYVTSIIMRDDMEDGKDEKFELLPPGSEVSAIQRGEWGEIEYLTITPPYKIKFRISPNKGKTPRIINIRFGEGDNIGNINLRQSKDLNQEEIQWDYIFSSPVSTNDIFIGSRYLGIQNWNCSGNAPQIYPSAVFPASTFATTFDKEFVGEKNPITLYTDFSDPFMAEIKQPSMVNYIRFLKEMQASEEYVKEATPSLNRFRLADLGAPDNIKNVFSDNPRLADAFCEIIYQKTDVDKFKNWVVGEIIFKGLTVTMDSPGKEGLFVDGDVDKDDPVYVKSITYGASAYFVIGSNLGYDEIKVILTKPSLTDDVWEKLDKTALVLITSSSPDEEADLSTSYSSLSSFMEHPYDSGQYGYPIYCTGCYLDDNSFFPLPL